MRKIVFHSWCSKATAGIRTSPDREQVIQELYDHLEDLYQALIDSGTDENKAVKLAIDTMGSAEDLASLLASVHRPFWGHVETFLRRALTVILVITVFAFGLFYVEHFLIDPILQDFDPDSGLQLSGTVRQTSLLDPDVSVHTDGYSITALRASLWQRTDETVQDYLNIQLRVTNPRPWAQVPEFSGWYWAEDSLGNYYYSAQEDSTANECAIHAQDYRTGFFTCVQDLWLSPYVSQEAQWIELHYNRSGRNIVLRIDLTGGEQP